MDGLTTTSRIAPTLGESLPVKPIKIVNALVAGWLPGGGCICVLCGHTVWRFLPFGNGSKDVPKLMAALDVVGSNADRFECPRCGAHDRERHLYLYMLKAGLLAAMRGKSVLHFAPEKRLAKRFVAAGPAQYVPCDLFPTAAHVQKVDMLAMQFDDQTFDLLIANHVLEHVSDDMQALREIHRVLKPCGHAILQVPYSRLLIHTWQDDGICSPAARTQAFGQSDHVRLYGSDVFERFASVGLRACVGDHHSLLPDIDPVRFGINDHEPFFLFQRET